VEKKSDRLKFWFVEATAVIILSIMYFYTFLITQETSSSMVSGKDVVNL